MLHYVNGDKLGKIWKLIIIFNFSKEYIARFIDRAVAMT